MHFPTQSFFVAGLSRSGVAAAEYLLNKGAKQVYLYDDVASDGVKAAQEALCRAGAVAVSAADAEKYISACDALVLSPGIPVDHPLPVAFRKAGKAIVGEAELGARALRGPVVAVTGTNGKTTTVSLLEHIFQTAGCKAVACGNVGTPITACLDRLGEDGVAVAEISSFQLETLTSLRPHVAVFLNLSEDHLDRHYTMENYIYLKFRMLKNSTESEYVVLNRDDPILCTFAEKTKAKTVWFSVSGRVDGAYLRDDAFYYGEERVCALSDFSPEGEHNRANALAAICAAKIMGIDTAAVAAGLKSFRGIRHRLEKIGAVGGVTFIDDSKATNVDSALKAIAAVRGECVLILGGKDKGEAYGPLFEALRGSDVVHTVLCGDNAFLLLNAAAEKGYTKLTLCRPFDMAVRIAYLLARPGQSILLSPASSGFDQFRNYEERGDRFAQLMRELEREAAARQPAEDAREEDRG